MGTFVAQLDGSPLAGDNCGAASLASALRWSTRHALAPSPSTVRDRMGDHEGGTRPDQLQPAWETFRAGARRRGYKLSAMRYREAGDFEALLDLLTNGDAAQVAVDYSLIPAGLSGDTKFDGMHSVFLAGIGIHNGERRVKVFDPLCDGRRQEIPGPGAVWWPVGTLRRAAASYCGAQGRATWNAVSRSLPLQDQGSCAERLAEVEQELEQAQEALTAAYRALQQISSLADEATGAMATLDMLRQHLKIGDPNAGATGGFRRV